MSNLIKQLRDKWLHSEELCYDAADRIEELETALRACHVALNVAFDYDGNVFGKKHNDACDADILACKALEKCEQ